MSELNNQAAASALAERIRGDLLAAGRVWRAWLVLDILLIVLSIVAPAIATYLGTKSVVEGKPAIQAAASPASENGSSDAVSPPPGWVRTCAWMAALALIGAVSTALHKGLKVEQRRAQRGKVRRELRKLDVELLRRGETDQIYEQYLKVIGDEGTSDAG